MSLTLADVKKGDYWPCPLCSSRATLYYEGLSKGNTRPHKQPWNMGGGPCNAAGFNPFRVPYPQLVRLVGKEQAVVLMRQSTNDPSWTPREDEPGFRRPQVKLDLTEPGSGLVLVTDSHWETPPQAQLGRREKGGWWLEDAYGDDGRKDYWGGGPTKEHVVGRYMEYLGYAQDTWDLEIHKEY